VKLTEGGRLDRPNVCTICERTPEIGTKVIDTERYFDGWPATLQGRRYVCERCINEMVKFFDFASHNEVAQAQIAQERAEAVVRGVKTRIAVLATDMKTIAADPSVFMEDDGGSIREAVPVGIAEATSEAPESSEETSNLQGDQSDVPSEDRAFGSADISAEGRHPEVAIAQSGVGESADSAA